MACGVSRVTCFRDLVAWRRSMELVDLVYELTERFPRREWFGLAQQMRRSAVSIPSNIAEGHRHTVAGYIHHLVIALGSQAELDTQCEVATRRGFVADCDCPKVQALLDETARVTFGLLRSLKPLNP